MEIDGAGSPVSVYSNEPEMFGNLISQQRDSIKSYFHLDGQQSTRNLTDNTGLISDTYLYSAFGGAVSASGISSNAFRYKGGTGYYDDGTDNDIYVRRRRYDQSRGRWLSRDPLESQLLHENAYTYVGNLPMLLDPTGLQPFWTHGYAPPHTPPAPPPTCVVLLAGKEEFPYDIETAYGSEIIIPNPVSTTDEILGIIRRNKCCNLVLFGHQGGQENCGGMTIAPPSGQDITVFPNFVFQIQLRMLFTQLGCNSCSITMFACSCDQALRRILVRKYIALVTGCTVVGTVPDPNRAGPGDTGPNASTDLFWYEPSPEPNAGCWGYSLTERKDDTKSCLGYPKMETIPPWK